jgi:CUB domain
MRLLLFIPLLLASAAISAQTFSMGNLGVVTNACGGVFYDSGGAAGQYGNGQNFTATFCAPAGQYISFDFTSFNTANAQDFLDIYDGPDVNAPLIGSYDGANGPGLVTSSLGGCLTFVFSSNNSGTAAGWVANISCNVTPPGTGDDCIAALGFCTNNTYTFPNNTDAGDLGAIDCLFSTPNPVWYYMQIQSPGTLNMNISQTTNAGVGIDVDFDLWGPFTSLPEGCAAIAAGTATSVDCSFSAAAIEQAVIPNAQVGQFYIILLTNFSNQAGEITFSTAAGSTAGTNCNILCGITDVTATPTACVPATNTYSVSGQVLVTNPPTSGNLVITSSCGGSVTIPGPFGNTINYTLPGLVPTGGACNLTASFSADATCNFTQTYLSPNSCSVNVLNCPSYASVSTSPTTSCAGQVYYLQVANTACNGTINFQVQGNWGLVASGPPPSQAQNASQISWNVTSNLTGAIVASGAGSSTVNGQNFTFNVGPLNPAVVGNLFTLNVFDSNGNGFGVGGNIAVYQNGAPISTVINAFGASSFTQFGANLTISPATITINTPTGPVVSTVTNCKSFKVPISLQNANFCNTVNLSLPWTITCRTSGAVISSGVNNITVYPSIPSTAEDIVDIVYDSLNCDWTVTPLNDCVSANIGSIFTITPNPLTQGPPSCQSGNATFEVVYNGVAGGPNCCATGGPQIPVVFNQSYPQANFSPANSPFGGTNNSAFLTIPPNNIGGIANSLSLSVSINGYCFNPPGAATSGQGPYWVTIIVDGQIVYDQITTNPAPVNNTVSINLANIPNGYSDDSVIQIYVYPNTLTSVTFNPLASCPLPNTPDGVWTAQIGATINASFNDNAPTPAVCNFNSLPFHPCCPPNAVSNAQSTICSGGSLAAVSAWQNTVVAPNPSCVVYSSVLPVAGSVSPVDNLTGVNLTSAAIVQSLSAYSYCDSDGSGNVNLGDTYTLISTYNLTINPGTTVGPASANPTICLGVALSPSITFTTTGATGIGSVNQLPTGLTASWNANIIIISGTPSVSGTFNYSIQVLGNCGSVNATGTITVINSVLPSFATVGPFCSGVSISALPTTSTNGIVGSWSPAINNTATTTYTFTPNAGQCATTAVLTITITPNVTPTFAAVGPFCSGASIPALPTTSANGIVGSWSPAINNTATTTYTFTPNAGQCATTAALTITITSNVTPTFAVVGPFCSGASISALPTTSTNGIVGSWSPAINNTATTTYTFTPNAGQCAGASVLTVVITPLPTTGLIFHD